MDGNAPVAGNFGEGLPATAGCAERETVRKMPNACGKAIDNRWRDAPLCNVSVIRKTSIVVTPFICQILVQKGIPLVECCQPLRNKNRRRIAISGEVVRPLDCSVLARVPRRRGEGITACRDSPAHTHGSTVGKCRIRPWPGKNNSAALGITKAWAPRKDRYGSKPA
jgi:hypothetical protein